MRATPWRSVDDDGVCVAQGSCHTLLRTLLLTAFVHKATFVVPRSLMCRLRTQQSCMQAGQGHARCGLMNRQREATVTGSTYLAGHPYGRWERWPLAAQHKNAPLFAQFKNESTII